MNGRWRGKLAKFGRIAGLGSALLATTALGGTPAKLPKVMTKTTGAKTAGAKSTSSRFSSEKLDFRLRLQNVESPYRVMSAFPMPGETLNLEVVAKDGQPRFVAEASAGEMKQTGPTTWTWTAPPTHGSYTLKIADQASGQAMTVNAFVKIPFDHKAEKINDYRIGRYQKAAYKGDPAYALPGGFIEVTPENMDTYVSPHFQLKQFICKQDGGWPKYALLKEPLLVKLEMVLEKVNEAGIEADTFAVMSGFRTPSYNKAIGNKTTLSRHHYGDAADVFVDQDKDGRIDDITGDNKSDDKDAKVIYDIVEKMDLDPETKQFIGGLSLYKAKPHRGPMVHIDARGKPARW